jgi:hypothetical protein
MSDPEDIMADVVVWPRGASSDPIHPPGASRNKTGVPQGCPHLGDGSRCGALALLWSMRARIG